MFPLGLSHGHDLVGWSWKNSRALLYQEPLAWHHVPPVAQAVSLLKNGVLILPYGNGHGITVLAAWAARLQGLSDQLVSARPTRRRAIYGTRLSRRMPSLYSPIPT